MTRKYFWVYMILCENNSFYTGYTTDLAKRYQSHVNGTGKCKYTRSFKPIRLVQYWKIQGTKSDAMKVEAHIKTFSRADKEALVHQPTLLCTLPNIEIITTQSSP